MNTTTSAVAQTPVTGSNDSTVPDPPDKPWTQLAKQRSIIEPNGCWRWQGATRDGGYAVVYPNNRQKRLTRLVLEERLGVPLLQHALHRCANAWCVNPEHLYAGDDRDNAFDVFAHGKVLTGHLHHAAKATSEKVEKAKQLREAGHTLQSIADKLGVSTGCIHNWLNGKKRSTPCQQIM